MDTSWAVWRLCGLLANQAQGLSSPKTQGWAQSSVNPDSKAGSWRKSILEALEVGQGSDVGGWHRR